jgi:hypothetical protein
MFFMVVGLLHMPLAAIALAGYSKSPVDVILARTRGFDRRVTGVVEVIDEPAVIAGVEQDLRNLLEGNDPATEFDKTAPGVNSIGPFVSRDAITWPQFPLWPTHKGDILVMHKLDPVDIAPHDVDDIETAQGDLSDVATKADQRWIGQRQQPFECGLGFENTAPVLMPGQRDALRTRILAKMISRLGDELDVVIDAGVFLMPVPFGTAVSLHRPRAGRLLCY